MLLPAVSVLVVAQSSLDIPEGLLNNPVLEDARVGVHSFLTLVLHGGEQSASHSGHFTSGESTPLYQMNRRVSGPQR